MINSIPDPEKKYPWSSPAERMDYIGFLRQVIQGEKEKIRKKHQQGVGGKEIAGDYSLLVDKVIEKAYDLAIASYQKSPNLSLVAIGGYGRGELSPYSDVDILFLHAKKILPWEQEIIHHTLCLLWDIKLQVGHSSRSISNCVEMAKGDLTVKTSLLESRYMLGSKDIFGNFNKALQKEIIEKGTNDFIIQKIEERNIRHASYDNSASLLEPNVKESPGGLRDYHIACWLIRAKYSTNPIKDLGLGGTFFNEEWDEVNKAYDFILRVRNEMHLTS
jgi:[protein-PII] uridylyltransferase